MASQQVQANLSALGRVKRPYVRKDNATTSDYQFPDSPPQLSEFAFNIHGWALEDGMTGRNTFEVINAYKATMVKGGFQSKIGELKSGGINDIYRDDLTYTTRELDEDLSQRDSAVCRYLVVGYSLQEDDPIFIQNKTFARYSENELVGETPPAPHHLINWSDCRTPMLVVTPVKENTGTSVRLFALIQPKSGLCQPVLIQHERIFYRWEFRASTGARSSQRNKNWNQLVVEKARLLTPMAVPETNVDNADRDTRRSVKRSRSEVYVKQEDEGDYMLEASDARDLQGGCLELYLSLGALLEPSDGQNPVVTVDSQEPAFMSHLKIELSPVTKGVLTAIRTSKNDRILRELRSILEVVKKPRDIPLDKSRNLLYFSLINTMFSMEEAYAIAEDIKSLWPEITSLVDVDNLIRMKQVMNVGGLAIGTETMHKFFPLALAHFVHDPYIDDSMLLVKLNEIIQLNGILQYYHEEVSMLAQPAGMDAVYLIALLRNLVRYHDWENKVKGPIMIQDRLSTPSAFVGQAFEYYINFDITQEVEELDKTVEELSVYAKNRGCSVEDVLLWLERLRLRIRQA